MNALDRYWLAPQPAVRSWLLIRAVLLLFAFDAFVEHLGPAWRYGTAGFNVAHFRVLDALLPMPTSAAYVGTLIATGLASFVASLSNRPPRLVLIAIAVAYAWSWSCSMHDSYQHHYLLSLFFVAFATFPLLSIDDLFGTPGARPRSLPTPVEPGKQRRRGAAETKTAKRSLADVLPHGIAPRASSWGLVLVWSLAAIVYAYTAVSKTDPAWLSGEALRRITHEGRDIAPAISFLGGLGLEGEPLWRALGHSVVLLQIGCAIGYALAPLRDTADSRLRRIAATSGTIALALALSFHLGAEWMGLEIGWFSGYMIILALVTFLPARALGWIVLFSCWAPAHWLGDPDRSAPAAVVRNVLRTATARSAALTAPFGAGALAVAAAALLVVVGRGVDLPGAQGGTMAVALALLAAAMVNLLRNADATRVRDAAFAAIVAAASLFASIRVGDARYDYWRFAGGDFNRRGEWQHALDAYSRAERYAPPGESRRDRIQELRARIATEGPVRAPDRQTAD